MTEWISVEEQHPPWGVRVLVYMSFSQLVLIALHEYCEEPDGMHWIGEDECRFHSGDVKFWMPLPEAPKQPRKKNPFLDEMHEVFCNEDCNKD